ncbi:Protein CBR-HPO-12 [Caenorhabditis briggsae]|uniref:Protein CBR-HPO-12 n=1 Tax=Caenorhabditis briggsae TaxID=6238 RepID=A8X0H5_CAEBR|nr:Protein CBR-HPO-12 [Caenorhabditis briggsae]CAP26135.1 Protein CBR-HPO-12 [Caenorhabditis briggsae]
MVGYHPEAINEPLTSAEYSEAGLASGIVTRMIIQPLDVLKIRFQLQEEPIRGRKSGKYKGVMQSVFLITREEGAKAFWKGHIPAQGLSATYGLVQFSSFEWLSRQAAKIVPSDDQSIRSTSDFMCGALSGCLAMTAAMPLDVIRTRLVAQKSGHAVYTGTMHAVKHIWEKEGIPGYFRGWIPSVVQIAPFTGMQFALYNCFMDLWPFTGYESTGALLSGAMAGTVAKTVLYPLDMVRHRLQMNGFERAGFGKTSNYSQGLFKTIVMVVKHESWYGLFKGLWPSQIKAAANSGCRIVSIHAASCTVSKLVFGTAADRTSSSRLFIGGVLLCCTSSICLAFASAVWQIELVMAMIGGVQGAGWVPATKLIASWFDDSSYATMFSLLGCGSTFAGMILPLSKSFYWRTLEFNTGFLVLVSALTCKKWIITEDAIRKEVKPIKKSELEEGDATKLTSIVKSPVIWHIAIVYFFSMELRTICETWAPLYLTEKNISPTTFQFLYELGGLIGIVTSGVMLDKLGEKFGVDPSRRILGVIYTTLMLLVAIGVFEFEKSSTIISFFTGFFVNGSFNIWCLIGSQAGTRTVAGTCSAFISFIASVGAIFAGSPLAYLIDIFSYQVFTVIFVTQAILILSISTLRIPLRMTTEKRKSD